MPSGKPHAPRPGYLLHEVKRGDPRNAPRCGAKNRRGTPCQSPAMQNGCCRMHGGTSTGPKTAKGITAIRNAHLKHGHRTKEAMEFRRLFSETLAATRRQVTECRRSFRAG